MTDEEALDLAKHDPGHLAELLTSGSMCPVDVSFAAEILGQECPDTRLVVDTLTKLMGHEKSCVREGAIYGLSCHPDSSVVRDILQKAMLEDPSEMIREIAQEMLDGIQRG